MEIVRAAVVAPPGITGGAVGASIADRPRARLVTAR